MKVNRRFFILSRIFFCAALILLCACMTSSMGFAGVAVFNLNVDLGVTGRGEELTQVVHITNCTLHPVEIVSVPSCGCMVEDSRSHILNAFRSLDVPIKYQIGPKMSGHIKRDVVVIYRVGDRVYRATGVAQFTVKP